MTVEDGKPEIVSSGNVAVEIQYKQIDQETAQKHFRDWAQSLARRAAREDYEKALIKARQDEPGNNGC